MEVHTVPGAGEPVKVLLGRTSPLLRGILGLYDPGNMS